jgi:transposase-like protein
MLDVDDHMELHRRAVELGTHPSKLVSRYIQEGLANDAEQSNDGKAKLYAVMHVVRQNECIQSQLKRYAWECLRRGDESGLETLTSLCEDTGFAVEEILEQARHHDGPPRVVYNGRDKVSEAINLLQSLGEKSSEYPSVDVYALGEQHSLGESVMKEAKRQMGIVSERQSKYWVWRWPETVNARVVA